MVEFMLLLPVIIGMVVILVRVNSAITNPMEDTEQQAK